jgi:hypothetical protein
MPAARRRRSASLVTRRVTAAWPASVSHSSSTRASIRPGATTSVARPMASASSAPIERAVNTMSLSRGAPISATSRA